MARINIEDNFWIDIMDVAVKMGSQDLAIGNVVRFFRHAQACAKNGKYISETEFTEKGFHEALFPSFAKREPSGIQAVGAEKHFGWLQQRKDAGTAGGKKSALRPRDSQGRLLKKQYKKTKESPSKHQANPSAHQPSSSYSPSTSLSPSLVLQNENPADSKARAFIAKYCERFKQRWGVNPEVQGKDAGIAKRLAKELGVDRFKTLLDAYFEMPDAWLVKVKHPLAAFETKLNEVVVYADSGKFTTNREAQQADSTVTNALLLQKVQRGEV